MTMLNTSINHDHEIAEIDQVFLLTNTSDLFLRSENVNAGTGEYLAYRVCRLPGDISNHVRRISFQFKHGNGDDLYGALLDLFIALGNNGRLIRKRMLEQSRSALEPGAYKRLNEMLDGAVDRFHPLGAVHCSVLSKGNIGAFNLVDRTQNTVINERDPLIEAREFIEYSQIDQARLLLENAILQEPARKEVHLELLDIYKISRDKDNFTNFFQQLNKVQNPVPEAWLEVADFFINLSAEEYS